MKQPQKYLEQGYCHMYTTFVDFILNEANIRVGKFF